MDYYLIGLGSNLHPDKNMIAARTAISVQVEELLILDASEVLINPPCGNSFHFPFHNQLLVIHSPLSFQQLKAQFEKIEIQLGREAKSPQRKLKDRTIDIDILHQSSSIKGLFNLPIEESYNREIMANWSFAHELSN